MNELRTKRYVGLTVIQLAILGCLAFMACGTIAGGFFLVASTGGGFSMAASPVSTSTPQPTWTPYLTETPTLTPTATLIPYEDLILPGWKQYTTANIEIWLPPQFEAADIEKERKTIIASYEKLGYVDIARQLEEHPSAYAFWFKVTEPGTNLFITNITIQPVLMTATNLDEFLDQEYALGPQEFRVVNRQDFSVGRYEARRILLEANLSNVYIGGVQYAIFDGVNVWLIASTSHFNEFYTWLPDFDKIARTFRFVDR